MLVAVQAATAQTRALGLDISAWQGNISQTTWNNFRNVENRQFVFIRSSRGGTTGVDHRAGGYPVGNNTTFNLSQRYDDLYFVQNLTRATAAGMFAGSYHRSRADVLADTVNSDGVTTAGVANNGADEADHMMQMAGAWMRPGYLPPVLDFEDGDGARTDQQMAQFALDFSNRIYEVMGIRPAIYTNGNYAHFILGGGTAQQRSQLAQQASVQPSVHSPAFPTLWSARWPNQTNPNAIDVQNGEPKDSYTNIYGPWDDYGVTHPWAFWQYASTGRLPSFDNGGSNLDFNVARGGIEFVKDQLVPALWWGDNDGDWSTLANWNSGQTPIAPVQAPGQLARVGPLTLPTPRLPGAVGSGVTSGQHDTVILDRPNASVTVTLSTGTHNIRKLYMREALDISGGTLTINYVPAADSTPIAAQFSGPVSLTGTGNLSVHTLQVDAQQIFSIGCEGVLTFNAIDLKSHSTTPAKILLVNDANFAPLNGAAAVIQSSGAGQAGVLDLGGAQRNLQVADGASAIDVSLNIPVLNGGLTKSGPGTLRLAGTNAYTGDTVVEAGKLTLGTATLDNAADVHLAAGTLLELNTSGATDIIDSLFIDGASQPAGIWGAVGSGAQFTSELLAGSGFLQVSTFVPPPLWGDYNENGTVDAGDYVVWRDAMDSGTALPNDDTPGVGADDYQRWRTSFGQTNLGNGATSNAAVPEPASAVLACVAGGVLHRFLARRRSAPRCHVASCRHVEVPIRSLDRCTAQ